MSNQTDLDWLVRNVHEWRDGMNFICVNHTDGGFGFHWHDRNFATWFTRQQWLARRAELQNKPSWESAQAQADFMAQEPHGVWTFFATQPFNPSQVNNDGWRFDGGFQAWSSDMRGEVLGDWRDTLERRPESPEKFKPFISIEDNQKQDMTQQATTRQAEKQQDNGWFERGELPPVGVECEYTLGTGAPWYQCEIKYVIRDDGVVMKRIPCGSEQYCGLHHKHPVSFRPIRTERDKAIDEMVCEFIDHYGDPKGAERYICIATKLYDSGYRREQK